ncbi:FK506-binding protein [Paramyrothecium foliicola]|nr:FK506-binding protein [Paramyrothecium foliicola]
MKTALFLSALASAAVGFVAAEDLKVDVTLPVECDRKTQNGDVVNMHYTGTLATSGKKFDSSVDRGTPFSFKLGSGQVIKGWDQGLLDMCIGEKRTLTIPPEYGYGQRAIGPIPAGSTLVFETELIGIDGVPKPEKIKSKVVDKAEAATEAAGDAAESASENIAEKVANVVSDAAEAAKTFVADTDEVQAHEEL